MTRTEIRGLEAPDPVLEREVRTRLDLVERALDQAVRSDIDFVTEAASYLVAAGGKRFRPLLVLLSGAFDGTFDDRLVLGSAAIELTHVATLYHDDVIDEAERRHGIPSVNVRWDNTVAILAGDFLFARASEISAGLGTDVSKLLARTIATLCEGQIREVETGGRLDQTVEVYMEIIRRKTAALVATSCRLGGLLSPATPETTDRLEAFGMALGMAFQLSDDIMDIISTEEELRKQPGQDLKEGVFTLPVLYALQQGPDADELKGLLDHVNDDDQAFDRALEIVRNDVSLAPARVAVTEEVRRAKSLAEGLPAGSPRDALVHIAEFIAVRCGAEA
ncbi:MAG TPA: geranylgeranyl pyrophosphate synthase [Actinobacteria bacterium]|nr:geranylgeranyl pyrophosphate synthase [Actinomycetota bacterium]